MEQNTIILNLASWMAPPRSRSRSSTRDWGKWSPSEQLDFANSFRWCKTPEREDILRFLIQGGDHSIWSTIALQVAKKLPTEESVPVIAQWAKSCRVGRGANYYQAIARTNSPEAHSILKDAYECILGTDGLMAPADFCNWIACDLISCIQSLLELDENPNAFRGIYDKLKHHSTESAQYQVRRRLAKYFENDLAK